MIARMAFFVLSLSFRLLVTNTFHYAVRSILFQHPITTHSIVFRNKTCLLTLLAYQSTKALPQQMKYRPAKAFYTVTGPRPS